MVTNESCASFAYTRSLHRSHSTHNTTTVCIPLSCAALLSNTEQQPDRALSVQRTLQTCSGSTAQHRRRPDEVRTRIHISMSGISHACRLCIALVDDRLVTTSNASRDGAYTTNHSDVRLTRRLIATLDTIDEGTLATENNNCRTVAGMLIVDCVRLQ